LRALRGGPIDAATGVENGWPGRRSRGETERAPPGGGQKKAGHEARLLVMECGSQGRAAPSRGEQLKIRFRREDDEGTNTSAEVYMHPQQVQNKQANCKSAMQFSGFAAQTVTSSWWLCRSSVFSVRGKRQSCRATQRHVGDVCRLIPRYWPAHRCAWKSVSPASADSPAGAFAGEAAGV